LDDSGAKEDRSGAENWRRRLGSAETQNNVQAEVNEARSRRGRMRGLRVLEEELFKIIELPSNNNFFKIVLLR
jgi:hypothetical protein